MLCPTSPSLPWVAGVSLPHVPWYYTTLRLPPALLGVLRLSLVPRYLACFPRSWCPCRARGQAEAPSHARAFGHPVPHSGPLVKETDGSPKFPSSPCEARPRSQTPVVSCALATAHPGLLPSGHCTASADHDAIYFGAPSRGLSPRYTRLRTAPYGEARGVATDLLARLSSGRTCTLRCAPTGEQHSTW